jgi:hypothetical protein
VPLVDTPLNITVIRLTQLGIPVKVIAVPLVDACAVPDVILGAIDHDVPLDVKTLPAAPAEFNPVPPFAIVNALVKVAEFNDATPLDDNVVNAPVLGTTLPIADGEPKVLFTNPVKPVPDTEPLQTMLVGVIILV